MKNSYSLNMKYEMIISKGTHAEILFGFSNFEYFIGGFIYTSDITDILIKNLMLIAFLLPLYDINIKLF